VAYFRDNNVFGRIKRTVIYFLGSNNSLWEVKKNGDLLLIEQQQPILKTTTFLGGQKQQ